MRLPIKLICRKNRLHVDGTVSVFIQYCYNSKQKVLLPTKIKIPPPYWDDKRREIKSDLPAEFGRPNEMNEELKRLFRIVEDLVTCCNRLQIPNKGKFVKEKFSPDYVLGKVEQEMLERAKKAEELEQSKSSLYFQFDEYIKSKQRKVSRATLTVYGNVKAHLLAFQKFRCAPITFESFDFNFYQDFVDYWTFDHIHLRREKEVVGLKLNTIGKTIKHLRGFIKDRVRRKIIAPIDLTDYKIPEEETDAIYLTHEEIGRIFKTDLSIRPDLIIYRCSLPCFLGLPLLRWGWSGDAILNSKPFDNFGS